MNNFRPTENNLGVWNSRLRDSFSGISGFVLAIPG